MAHLLLYPVTDYEKAFIIYIIEIRNEGGIMKRNLKILMFLLVAVFLCSGNVFAGPFGDDITIYDNRGDCADGNVCEDSETEPGMINDQSWDLEGFFLNGSLLTMVGGFDFKDGHPNYQAYTSGDIFIDTDSDASYGKDAKTGEYNLFGYDYVLDLDIKNSTYTVFQLGSNTTLSSALEPLNNPYSNPWKYNNGGTFKENGTLIYTDFPQLIGVNTGFSGDFHNAVTVDLSFLDPGQDFTAHFTMGCGNDNLMGKGTTSVPEPTPMLLLGGALVGLAGIGRRKFFKN